MDIKSTLSWTYPHPAPSVSLSQIAGREPRSAAEIQPTEANDMNTQPQAHPQLATLPEWPARTIAVLATAGPAPHAIPVSAPVRAGDRRILLSLQRSRGSLARLRARPSVALLVLTAGNI